MADAAALRLPELAELDTATLMKLVQTGEEELAARKKRERAAFFAEMRERAAALGLNPDELAGSFGKGGARRASPSPKYRNPDNPAETWSGRGAEPKWLRDLESQGRRREEFIIQ